VIPLALLCAFGFIAWTALRIVRVLMPYKSLYGTWPKVEKLTGKPWHLVQKGPAE
jgi:hypothetical protein